MLSVILKYRSVRKPPVRLIIGVFLLAVILLLAGCKALPGLIDQYLSAANQNWGFDGAVMVAVDGHVVFEKGYGPADRAVGDKNTPDTKYFVGSITKQFTAAAILKLQEQGKLDINDPISKYLENYPAETADRITIRQLLNQTSGVPNYTDNPEILLRRMNPITPGELMTVFMDLPLDFEPGERFEYSNSNYIILGAIIEAVSGQSYEAYLSHNILKPAGMENSGYGRRVAGVPQRAIGYTTGENSEVVKAVPIDFSILHTAGALYTTANDLLRWDRALSEGKILKPGSIRAMLRPGKGNYGFGWFIEARYGRTHTYHGGFLDGYNCTFDRWLEDNVCIAVLSNRDDAPVKKIARGLAAIMFGEPPVMPVKKTPAQIATTSLKRFEGLYRVDSTEYRRVDLDHDTLYTYLIGQPRQKLLPQDENDFFFASDNTVSLGFIFNDSGAVAALVIQDEGLITTAWKVPPEEESNMFEPHTVVAVDSETLQKYAGKYRLASHFEMEDGEFYLTIIVKGDDIFAEAEGGAIEQIYPQSQTEFYHKTADFGIIFITDDGGNVTGCTVEMAGVRVEGVKVE